jgi:hypothetical protein
MMGPSKHEKLTSTSNSVIVKDKCASRIGEGIIKSHCSWIDLIVLIQEGLV